MIIGNFGDIDPATHNDRLLKIRYLDRRIDKYNKISYHIDDPRVALYYCLQMAREKGMHGVIEFALKELEKLYADDISKIPDERWKERVKL